MDRTGICKGLCKRSSFLVLVKVKGWLHSVASKEIIRKGKLHWMELIRRPAHDEDLSPSCHPSYCPKC